jgi:hypothetical protein
MTLYEIRKATRKEIVAYLESWGYACYNDEPLKLLRATAMDNCRTEGPGFGPLGMTNKSRHVVTQ